MSFSHENFIYIYIYIYILSHIGILNGKIDPTSGIDANLEKMKNTLFRKKLLVNSNQRSTTACGRPFESSIFIFYFCTMKFTFIEYETFQKIFLALKSNNLKLTLC